MRRRLRAVLQDKGYEASGELSYAELRGARHGEEWWAARLKIDPLAGSYYVEALTDRLEAEAEEIFAEVERQGGVVAGIERGYFQREIARSAQRQQREIESGDRVVVGVNQ